MESLFEALERLEEPVDLILYAGDDIGRFEADGRNIFLELAAETRLGTLLAVRGNDDLPLSSTAIDGEGIHDLHQEPFIHENYVFLGLDGAIEGGPGFILHTEDEIADHLRQQYAGHEDKLPVLVSHVPPNGVLDIGLRFGQRHIGSTSVRAFLEEAEPVLTVCGHCHQFGGRAEELGSGTVINIASHDSPGSEGRYSIIELDGRAIEYELTTTEAGVEHWLLQLSQVGGRRIQHLLEADITELEQFTEANRETLESLPGSSPWHVDMWLKESEAIRNGELRVLAEQDFEFLTGDNVVLLDIETDLSQDRIWLIGLYSYHDGGFDHIFEKDDEEKLLRAFIDYLQEHAEPTVVYYGNNYFDEKCLKHRMGVHGLEEGLDLLEDAHDLGILIYKNLLGGFTRTTLGSLAGTIADYDYRYPEMDGFIVGTQYTRYLLNNEEPDWDKLLSYNKDDVLALKAVVDQIRGILNG